MRLCKDGLNQATSRSKGRADGDDSDDDWGGWKAVAPTPVEVMEVDDEEEDGPPHWPRAPQETPEIDEKDRAVAQNIYAAPQETPWRISRIIMEPIVIHENSSRFPLQVLLGRLAPFYWPLVIGHWLLIMTRAGATRDTGTRTRSPRVLHRGPLQGLLFQCLSSNSL
jgi:hypothetical protein